MQTEAQKKHAEYVHNWLNDPAYPERLEKKKQRDKEYHQKNKESRLAYHREYYRQNTAAVKATALKHRVKAQALVTEARRGPCSDCGNTFNPRIMQFHHRDPSTKSCDVGSVSTVPQAKREMDKCDLLCPNCHAERHYG